MTTLREAATKALETLEDSCTPRLSTRHYAAYDEAITALKAALEQPEQEPVAWRHRHIEGNVITHRPADLDRHPDRWTPLYKNPTPCETCQALARTVMMDQTAHDNYPPRREWQGLTDAELREAYLSVSGNEWCLGGMANAESFYEAIESKLKERNT
jgi:hypothetical protein